MPPGERVALTGPSEGLPGHGGFGELATRAREERHCVDGRCVAVRVRAREGSPMAQRLRPDSMTATWSGGGWPVCVAVRSCPLTRAPRSRPPTR